MAHLMELFGRIPAASQVLAHTQLFWTMDAASSGRMIGLDYMNESATTNAQLAIALQQVATLGAPAGTAATYNHLSNTGGSLALSDMLCDLSVEPTSYGQQRNPLAGASLGGIRWRACTPDEAPYMAPGKSYGISIFTVPATTFNAICRVLLDISI